MDTSASHSPHSSCLLKALWPPKNTTSFIPPFSSPSLHKSWHKGLSSAVEEGKHFPALSRDAHFHVLDVQNGKQGQTPLCGLTTHPEHKTPVEAGRVVHVDLYISRQPNYYPVISFSPLNDNPHTRSGGNSKQ